MFHQQPGKSTEDGINQKRASEKSSTKIIAFVCRARCALCIPIGRFLHDVGMMVWLFCSSSRKLWLYISVETLFETLILFNYSIKPLCRCLQFKRKGLVLFCCISQSASCAGNMQSIYTHKCINWNLQFNLLKNCGLYFQNKIYFFYKWFDYCYRFNYPKSSKKLHFGNLKLRILKS